MQISDDQADVQHSIPDLDNVQIKLGDDDKKISQISSNTTNINQQQPQQNIVVNQSLPAKTASPSFLSQLFHCIFKGLAIFVFFIPEGILSLTYCFIIVVILSAIDFWTVKNITGRKLVGLRWWSEVREDGTENWIYESQDANFIANPFNSNIFWFAQFGAVLTWAILSLLDLIGLRWFNAVLAITGLCLTGINFMGFYKCRGEHQKKAKEYMTKIGLKALQKW